MGKKSQRKGYLTEHNLELILRGHGIDARRVPLSGATSFAKGDLVINWRVFAFECEVKARANGFKRLYELVENSGGRIVRLNGDFYLMSLVIFINLLQFAVDPDVKTVGRELSPQVLEWIRGRDILFLKANYKPYLVILKGGTYDEILRVVRSVRGITQ